MFRCIAGRKACCRVAVLRKVVEMGFAGQRPTARTKEAMVGKVGKEVKSGYVHNRRES